VEVFEMNLQASVTDSRLWRPNGWRYWAYRHALLHSSLKLNWSCDTRCPSRMVGEYLAFSLKIHFFLKRKITSNISVIWTGTSGPGSIAEGNTTSWWSECYLSLRIEPSLMKRLKDSGS
jgi:hypothetical protein